MREIKLINSSRKILVDDEDWGRASLIDWRVKSRKDGIIKATGSQISIQRFIMRDSANFYDHIDRNIWNNQKSNLRKATHAENCANRAKIEGEHTSEYKGLDWFKPYKCWRVRVRKVHIGYFDDEIEAARAYNKRALKVFGEFACLNKVD